MLQVIKTLFESSAFRFGIASILGLLLDLILVLAFLNFLHLSLPVSAGFAFAIVGTIFYFVHEYWTFRRAESQASSRRLIKSIATQSISLVARVGSIALIEASIMPPAFMAAQMTQVCIWAVGVGISFSMNFILNKLWVFK